MRESNVPGYPRRQGKVRDVYDLGDRLVIVAADPADFPPAFHRPEFAGRTMVVRKTEVVPVECVVRGYLAGSGWKDYRRTGNVCGVTLRAGLREADALPEPVFTPATKAETGHDE